MDFKKTAIGFGARVLRIVGIIAVIYLSMVFYLALTERRNAFPRAITHKEARAAIEGKAKSITCTTEDGTALEGWALGQGEKILLYYPDADEDAAQFLAEAQSLEGVSLVAFNYRGSGSNKGTPSQETFEPDARAIMECASQMGSTPAFIAGRGTGAILAAEQMAAPQASATRLILIDPVASIADAINEKYGWLYPSFLVRAKVEMPNRLSEITGKRKTLVFDRKMHRDRNHAFFEKIGNLDTLSRGDKTLNRTLSVLTSEQP